MPEKLSLKPFRKIIEKISEPFAHIFKIQGHSRSNDAYFFKWKNNIKNYQKILPPGLRYKLFVYIITMSV